MSDGPIRALAVLVLYKVAPADSPSFRALQLAMQERSTLAERLRLIVFDNSPEIQALPGGSLGEYRHDGKNQGRPG